ncbi:MAG: hypothetical protein GVY23_04895, partial [Spirochaetes bacterium]|nr:hypothetical protein [Spirochaetota bacterium]
MNITLSADDALVRKARRFAQEHETSLNQLIRYYLEHPVGEFPLDEAAREYAAVASTRLGQPRDAVTRQTFLLERFEVVSIGPEIIRNGLEIGAQ